MPAARARHPARGCWGLLYCKKQGAGWIGSWEARAAPGGRLAWLSWGSCRDRLPAALVPFCGRLPGRGERLPVLPEERSLPLALLPPALLAGALRLNGLQQDVQL